jgi:hypothetical protein
MRMSNDRRADAGIKAGVGYSSGSSRRRSDETPRRSSEEPYFRVPGLPVPGKTGWKTSS